MSSSRSERLIRQIRKVRLTARLVLDILDAAWLVDRIIDVVRHLMH